jgi:hypothetical protein
MTETSGSSVREIRKIEQTSEIQIRQKDCDKIHKVLNSMKRVKSKSFDKTSFQWLE